MGARILHVIPHLEWGSAETQVGAIVRRCGGEFDMHVATGRMGPRLEAVVTQSGAAVHALTSTRGWGDVDPLQVFRLIGRLRPHVIHLWRVEQSWPAALAVAGSQSTRSIVDLRLPGQASAWLPDRLQRWVVRRADRVVAHASQGALAAERQRAGDRLIHVEDMVDCAHGKDTRPPHSIRDQLAREYNIPQGARLVLWAGRLLPRKRLRDAIWASDLLKVIRDDVHLLLAGDGPEYQRLRRYQQNVRIGDRVHFLGSRWDVPSLMAAADCLWCCSQEEDTPLALVEAQRQSLPVIATRIAAHRPFVADGHTGLSFAVGDRAGLARATVSLLDDPSRAQALAREALRHHPATDDSLGPVRISGDIERRDYREVYGELTHAALQ